MADDRYIRGDKDEILHHMLTGSDPGSRAHEQMKMAIFVRCTKDLEASIRNFIDSNNRLAKQILILSVIFGIFTMVGTFLGAYQIFWK